MKKEETVTSSFKCPYCFEQIEQDKVCFLIKPNRENQYSDEELSMFAPEMQEEIRNKQKKGKPYLQRKSDKELEEFWKDLGGAASYVNNARYADPEIGWNAPLVTPENVDSYTNGFERDSDGFIVSVTDKFSNYTSKVRICPHCHNPLPKMYGKYPIHSISVVGIKSSGKTVYLTQLISELEKYLNEIGIDLFQKDGEADSFKKIDNTNSLLPKATLSPFSSPISILIKKGPDYNTLVFYDIAGEYCVDADKMERYGTFIKNADGIIVLIDPNQFPNIAADNDVEDALAVSTVLQTIKESFLAEKTNKDGKVEMPFAFVVSKSDYLEKAVQQDARWKVSPLTKPLVCHGKINMNELIQMKSTTRSFINKFAPSAYLTEMISEGFENYAFLAVSALGCDTKNVFANPSPLKGDYYFDGNENVRTLMIDIDKETENKIFEHISKRRLERDPRKTCYLSYDPKNGIKFDLKALSKKDYESEKVVQFRIDTDAHGEELPIYEQYLLNGEWADGASLLITKVPLNIPQPRRVEEPLHWMLNKFHLAEA